MTWRPRRFRLGAMRETITIESPETDETSGEPNRTWVVDLACEPAAFEQVSGGETLRGRQVNADVSAVFTVRYQANLYNTKQRVSYGELKYGIVNITPVEGGRRYMELDCRVSDAVEISEVCDG